MKDKIFKVSALVGAALALVSMTGCGDSKSTDTAAAPTCETTAPSKAGAYVLCVGAATSATVELTGGAGEEYVVAPFTLGDHGTVQGGGEQTLSFAITATSASLQTFKRSQSYISRSDVLDRSNTLRMIANRFDATKGRNQEPWIWPALKRLDLEEPRAVTDPSSSLTNQFRTLADQGAIAPKKIQNLTASNCPATVVGSDGSTPLTLASSYDGTSFCVGYQANPSNDTKANIEASIKVVVDTFKNTIYQDQMTTNVKGGYTFNPIIVFVSSLGFDGAFSRTATTVTKRPVLHIKASLDKDKIHSTIAHEMQHAIVDYYKERGTTTITETVGMDEGVAHLMEDAFGYGSDNFSLYVKNFLSTYVDGTPILSALEKDFETGGLGRGGANALVYFMGVRAGGFTVSGGKPFSGEGMKAIVSMVKQTSLNGPAALAAAFGQSNLTWRVGQLIGALSSDNKAQVFTPAEFLSTTYTGITNLQGATGLTFGFRFNNFNSFTSVEPNALSDASSIDQPHYATSPTLVKPTAATSTVTFALPGVANTGISVIRTK